MRVLLIDNYDSYTYNLAQLLATACACELTVLPHDDPALRVLRPADFDCVVISPGPGRPQRPADVGWCANVLAAHPRLPVLGVCLGHQLIAHAEGAVVREGAARHGFVDRVRHEGSGLFAGLPQRFPAVRYHSLRVLAPLPDSLRATAWAADGTIMAIEHRRLPRWGVQFHPESVATGHGAALVRNFAALVAERPEADVAQATASPAAPRRSAATRQPGPVAPPPAPGAAAPHRGLPAARSRRDAPPGSRLELTARVIGRAVDGAAAFAALYRASPAAFWLDGGQPSAAASRFSFLGDDCGPLAERLTYRAGSRQVLVSRGGRASLVAGTIFDVLRDRLAASAVPAGDLPFALNGGYVGYLGYEVKADCGGSRAWRGGLPDAQWLFAGRLVVIDHAADQTYVLTVGDGSRSTDEANRAWTGRVTAVLSGLGPPRAAGVLPVTAGLAGLPAAATLARRRERYLADVGACLRELRAGESYEICLTNQISLPPAGDPLEYYLALRRINPAPYAAYLRLGDFAVLSSSPESFLRMEAGGGVRARPIKGTAARDADPAADARQRLAARSAKNRAENLMITDLLRNDLGRVCEPGSVAVPGFCDVESYASVHQLVSTITGTLRPDVSPVDCVRQCFPGGSMTGAPKIRTMRIIDRLEGAPRGVYSGALGYFGLGGGGELSVVIRTAVATPAGVTIGTGGAIVLDSDPAAEFAEAMCKAEPLLRGYELAGPAPAGGGPAAGSSPGPASRRTVTIV